MWNASLVDEVTGEESAIDLSLQDNTFEGMNLRQVSLRPRYKYRLPIPSIKSHLYHLR